MEIRRILVPTDFSDHSDRALAYAAELAPRVGAKEILLLHVIELPPTPVPLAGAVGGAEFARLEGAMRDSALRDLGDRVAKCGSPEVRVVPSVTMGTAALSITDAAVSNGVDLIVMGSRGRSGLAHVLFGSVAERTVAKAPCPVLTVKAPEGEAD